MGGGGGDPGASPGYSTLSNSPVQIGLKHLWNRMT